MGDDRNPASGGGGSLRARQERAFGGSAHLRRCGAADRLGHLNKLGQELPRILIPRTPVNRGHQGAATGFGENLHDHEHLVAHAGLLPLLLSAIPKDESLEALPHILVFPDERRVGLAGGPITHSIAADEARAPTLSCSPRSTTVSRP